VPVPVRRSRADESMERWRQPPDASGRGLTVTGKDPRLRHFGGATMIELRTASRSGVGACTRSSRAGKSASARAVTMRGRELPTLQAHLNCRTTPTSICESGIDGRFARTFSARCVLEFWCFRRSICACLVSTAILARCWRPAISVCRHGDRRQRLSSRCSSSSAWGRPLFSGQI